MLNKKGIRLRSFLCVVLLNPVRTPILILNWNGWDDTMKCLNSLRTCPDAAEVWLIDNGSREDRSAECLAICPELRVVKLADNYGWSGGYNRALKLAASEGIEIAYLLNNDSLICPGFLSATKKAMLADPRLAAVGSVILFNASQLSVKFDGLYYSEGAKPFIAPTVFQLRQVTDVMGAGMLIRLSAMEKEGYFDERFFCYGEEVEWCWRVGKRGWQIAICNESLVVHQGEGSNCNGNAIYYQTRNKFLQLEHDVATVSVREKFKLTKYLLQDSVKCWQANEREACAAIAEGLRDGWNGRFGRRIGVAPGFFHSGLAQLFWLYFFWQGRLRLRERLKKQLGPGLVSFLRRKQ